MTEPTPHPPRLIEIYVDGTKVHAFLASRFVTNETGDMLTLEAGRWLAERVVAIENPLLRGATAVLDGLDTTTDIGVQAGEFLTDPTTVVGPGDVDPRWKIYGPGEPVPACPYCRMVLGENGDGHAKSCITQIRHIDRDDTEGES